MAKYFLKYNGEAGFEVEVTDANGIQALKPANNNVRIGFTDVTDLNNTIEYNLDPIGLVIKKLP